MRRHAIWHGTAEECTALLRAINFSCSGVSPEGARCTRGPLGERLGVCAAHSLLLDQRALNGLLWMRRMAPRLVREECGLAGEHSLPEITETVTIL